MQQKELARLLGISPAMVSRLVKRGMPCATLEAAQRWRRRHLELARLKTARASVEQTSAQPAAAVSDDDEPEDADPDLSSSEYRQARAARETQRLERERIELDRLRGSVVDVAEAGRMVFTAFRTLRDSLQNVPMRINAQCAAETDPLIVEQLIGREIDAVLSAFDPAGALTDTDEE